MTEIIDAEVVEDHGTALAVRQPTQQLGLFNSDDPATVMAKATNAANVLKDVIKKQGLISNINGKEYILFDGWTMFATVVGVTAMTEYTRPVGDGEGWEAAVVVVNGSGVQIGRAEAQCLRSERNWKNRDDFALRSMAQTRAAGKALRMPLGFIAVLAGYEATPAEEMPVLGDEDLPFSGAPAATRAAAVRAEKSPLGGDAHGVVGATPWASELNIEYAVDLATRLGKDAEEKLFKHLEEKRGSNKGHVPHEWLVRQVRALEKKVAAAEPKPVAEEPAAESQFTIPESAR